MIPRKGRWGQVKGSGERRNEENSFVSGPKKARKKCSLAGSGIIKEVGKNGKSGGRKGVKAGNKEHVRGSVKSGKGHEFKGVSGGASKKKQVSSQKLPDKKLP